MANRPANEAQHQVSGPGAEHRQRHIIRVARFSTIWVHQAMGTPTCVDFLFGFSLKHPRPEGVTLETKATTPATRSFLSEFKQCSSRLRRLDCKHAVQTFAHPEIFQAVRNLSGSPSVRNSSFPLLTLGL